MRCAVGVTGGFQVVVGLNEGSAPSPFLFAMVMGKLTNKVRQDFDVCR